MRLAEMESQLLNSIKTEDEIEKNLLEAMKLDEEYPDFSLRWTKYELESHENRWRRIAGTLKGTINSLKREKGEL